MSFRRELRFGRHFTGPFTGTGSTDQTVGHSMAIDRMSMLARAMAAVSLLEMFLVFAVKGLAPEFVADTHEVGMAMLTVTFVLSLVTYGVTRVARVGFKLRLVTCVGYVFAVGILVAAAEASTEWWVDGGRMQGMPWVCLWLLVVPLVVPIRWEKAIARGVGMSLMPVAVLFVGVWSGKLASAPPEAYLDFFLPALISTVLSLVIAKMMYSLTRQVTEARRLGSYELEEKIGSGGMGEVWRARHRMLVRPGAVKLIRPEKIGLSGQEHGAIVDRFQREAQATASLRSPHTVELYDFGVAEDGTLFYVMELLQGLDLQALIERFGPLPANRVIKLMQQMCCSLADAHANGLLHRDIKPANIFVCRVGQQTDFVKILDFGLVKSVTPGQGDVTLTMEQSTLGTPAFMAPEAVGKGKPDHRLDLYSLGCVGYWLLTGSFVFEADSPMAMAVAHAKDEPAPPSTRTELEVPEELDRIILDCLAKKPEDRPKDAGALIMRLAGCSCGEEWTPLVSGEWWRTHLPEYGAVSGGGVLSSFGGGA